jgi:chaperone required for assembly of F1-ATPase
MTEADQAAKKKDVPLGMLKADGSSKRFYKAASVMKVEQDDPRTGGMRTMWALTLDGRQVRTPANKLLTLPSADMAMAIALEFDVQDTHILPYTMPMTTLATTAIDQISRSDVRKSCITGMLRQLNNDLITLRSSDPDDLVESEKEIWGGICGWASTFYKCSVNATDNWLHMEQDQALVNAVEADLTSRSDWCLAVIDNVSGATGSTLIAVALFHGFLDAKGANRAARLQEQYQVGRSPTSQALNPKPSPLTPNP